jgi:hypothetical protein
LPEGNGYYTVGEDRGDLHVEWREVVLAGGVVRREVTTCGRSVLTSENVDEFLSLILIYFTFMLRSRIGGAGF